MEQTYFRRGFGLRKQIEPLIRSEYHSALVERIRSRGYQDTWGEGDRRVTIRLAEEFGFCYGVDRAVEYAYETRTQFPERRIFLLGEIIHNPHVNRRLTEMGVVFLHPDGGGRFDFGAITPEDVVILPAFGATVDDFRRLQALGCILVDTTCGSVLNVWKRVEQYARDGFTALVHGKYLHEETRATASQALKYPEGRFIIVRDMAEARLVMDYIERAPGALTREAFLEHFRPKASEGFDPDLHLERIGVANQTTMLSGDSLAIAAEVAQSLERRYGGEGYDAAAHFRSFDTICSATQERQDAVEKLVAGPDGPPDVMVVIGGYNSSNTHHLAVLCARHAVTFHVADADRIDPARGTIRFKPAGSPLDAPEVEAEDWLPAGPLVVGITAGASTPNVKIGEAVERLLRTRGIAVETEDALAATA
ncbi:4-hydroxy-3-methylbut-2-enyl diphosphate reductase [Longimicrobium sp.]|uniref:4-hydroxy-3-methylbut-2-enyl diphosphate reductase n=1 Tax=Longimicrobium sp. TaxID=2029185 RepID=UPI002E35B8EE|nr:4-hydroxy-3-methylbut-2-enyl diphosphate reductase [Longimicrobium sp.]HEX6039983.1 4-hydroxy-3-methylbut-2-enyl diphosphate reductase [Longimicrobium sp.]